MLDLHGSFTRELIYTYRNTTVKCIMYNSNCFATKLTVIALLRVVAARFVLELKSSPSNKWMALFIVETVPHSLARFA